MRSTDNVACTYLRYGLYHHVIAYVTSCMDEAQVIENLLLHKLAPKSEYASGCLVGAAIKAQAEQPAWTFHAPSIQLCWYAPMFHARPPLQIMSLH